MTALAQVADTANNRSWIWHDDTATFARIAGIGSSPAYQPKGFGSLRGMGTATQLWNRHRRRPGGWLSVANPRPPTYRKLA